jgi:hemerythrin superfamily protein
MTIFEILKLDHEKVSALFKQINSTTDRNIEKRESLFEKLQSELTAHAAAEEKAVYSPLKMKDKIHEDILEAYEEHHLADTVLDEIADLSPTDETWKAKMTVLKEMFEHHVKEEESVLFKEMKTYCSKEELVRMAEDFTSFKKEIGTSDLRSNDQFEQLGIYLE